MVMGVVAHAFRLPTQPHTQAGEGSPGGGSSSAAGGRALAECETGPMLRRMVVGRMVAADLDPAREGQVRWWLLTPAGPTLTPAGQSLCPGREA